MYTESYDGHRTVLCPFPMKEDIGYVRNERRLVNERKVRRVSDSEYSSISLELIRRESRVICSTLPENSIVRIRFSCQNGELVAHYIMSAALLLSCIQTLSAIAGNMRSLARHPNLPNQRFFHTYHYFAYFKIIQNITSGRKLL